MESTLYFCLQGLLLTLGPTGQLIHFIELTGLLMENQVNLEKLLKWFVLVLNNVYKLLVLKTNRSILLNRNMASVFKEANILILAQHIFYTSPVKA